MRQLKTANGSLYRELLMTPRPGRTDLARLEQSLTATDWAVLDSLARVRVATGGQIQRLHFTSSPTSRGAARVARHHLLKLTERGLVVRLARVVGGPSAGSRAFTYALGAAGQRLLTQTGPAGGRRLRRPWEPSERFLRHSLAVTELYVRLVEHERATRSDAFEVLAFEAEPQCWRTFSGSAGERLVLKPDAFLAFGTPDFEERWFVEVDLATEGRGALERKASVYGAYYQTGIEQRRFDIFPSVAWLVPDEQHVQWLRALLARLSPDWKALWNVQRFEAFPDLLSVAVTEV